MGFHGAPGLLGQPTEWQGRTEQISHVTREVEILWPLLIGLTMKPRAHSMLVRLHDLALSSSSALFLTLLPASTVRTGHSTPLDFATPECLQTPSILLNVLLNTVCSVVLKLEQVPVGVSIVPSPEPQREPSLWKVSR